MLGALVVGAGFSGIACATALAKRSIKVVLLERKADIRHSIHTTGILVQEAYDAMCPPAHLVRAIEHVRIYSSRLHSIRLRKPGYRFYATETGGLLHWLLEEARAAGVEVRMDTAINHIEEKSGSYRVNQEFDCRFIIGADGARSKVAQLTGLGKNTRFLTGVEVELEPTLPCEESLHAFIDHNIAPGYIGWVLPGVGVTQLGVACNSVKPVIEPVMEKVCKALGWQTPPTIVARRGGLIPVGGNISPISKGNILLVGDAAGMVSPLTAGGIHTAWHYGDKLGEWIADHQQNGAIHPSVLLQKMRPRFGIKHALRALMDTSLPSLLLDHALESTLVRKAAERIFFKEQRLPFR